MDKNDVIEVLRKINDPEFPVSVVDMGIVGEDDITVEEGKVSVTFTPTSSMCPMGGVIGVIIKNVLEDKLGVDVEVKVRPGTHINEEAINDMLSNKARYNQVVKQLKESGMLERCFVD